VPLVARDLAIWADKTWSSSSATDIAPPPGGGRRSSRTPAFSGPLRGGAIRQPLDPSPEPDGSAHQKRYQQADYPEQHPRQESSADQLRHPAAHADDHQADKEPRPP
jgi:hypothetical protein